MEGLGVRQPVPEHHLHAAARHAASEAGRHAAHAGVYSFTHQPRSSAWIRGVGPYDSAPPVGSVLTLCALRCNLLDPL